LFQFQDASSADELNGNGNEEAKTNNEIRDPDDPEEKGISAAECGRRCWKQYLGRDDSLVTDLFLGQLRKE
jgi:ubiquitin C-terminal hydrolase